MFATRRLRATLALVLCAAAPLAAVAASDGGGSFRLWSHGARDLALGGASTLISPDLESLFVQPASLVAMDGWELGACVQSPTGGPELTLSSLAVGRGSGWRRSLADQRQPASSRAFALAFQHLGATLADDGGWGETTLAAAGAWSPMPWLSLGLQASHSSGGSDDGVDRGSAVSVSGGLRAAILHPALVFGWVAGDIHQNFHWDGGPDRRRASSQSFALAIDGPGDLAVELLSRLRFGAVERYAIGAEWWPWSGRLALRGGLVNWRVAESYWSSSFGTGIRQGALGVDYGFLWSAEDGPGGQHRLSLHWAGAGGERNGS